MPELTLLPPDYAAWLAELKTCIQAAARLSSRQLVSSIGCGGGSGGKPIIKG